MKFDEQVYMDIQSIYNDLQLLDDGHFLEQDPQPGTANRHTLAARMRKRLAAVEKAIKERDEQ